MSADARVRELLRRVHETNGTPEDVCRDCPELLAEVRERWEKLRALDDRLRTLFPSSTDAGAPEGRSDVDPPPRFPGYEIADELGSGGMGVVYKAREASTGRLVALKLVHPHLRRLPGFVERLTREAEIGRQVVHENVVRTIGLAEDATRAASRLALVTEFVEGQTLRALLAEMGRVPEQLCRHVGREIAKGLAAIHAIGAVHRDLKPENVLITTGDVVKVMDLGVARLLDVVGRLSGTGVFVGSLRYAAPEQLRRDGSAVDGRADLYALGLTLFELSTGNHPFRSDEGAGSSGSGRVPVTRRAGELNPQLSPFFEEVLARLLEPDREMRLASATEIARVFDEGEESSWWRERSSAIRGTTRTPPHRIRITRETPLHGREVELTLLRERFADAAQGNGRVVLAEGEAGIGKSRLLDEFAALLHRRHEDLHLLFGGYAPDGGATAGNAFSAAYRELFGEADLKAALHRHLAESPSLAGTFAAMLRGEPPPPGAEVLTNDTLRTVFIRTTQSLATERPVVVTIEDLHLAPKEGRALFAALAAAVPGHRVLLVGTARPSIDPQWADRLGRLPHASRIALRRLGRHELTALLRDSLGSAQAADDLAPEIVRKSDGNPYFAFELLRGLRERGLLQRSAEGSWTATRAIRDVPSPSSITDLIGARVAELGPQEREAAEVAACCGHEFDPLLVGDALGLPGIRLLRRLAILEARGLLRSVGRRVAFDHHQVHEVLYAGLSPARRELHHAAIASSLERRAGAANREPKDLDGELCAGLAGHFLEGAQGTRALRYLDAALDHLERSARNDAAVRCIERALATPGLASGARRCELLLRLSHCFERSGNLKEEARVLEELNALADTVGEPALRARARLELGVNLAHAWHYEDALGPLLQSQALYREAGDLKGEARATVMIGSAHASLGRHEEALLEGRRGIELTRAVGDRKSEETAICNLGNLFLMMGHLDEARSHLELSASLCRADGPSLTEGRVAANLGNTLWTLGLFADAQAQYEVYLSRSKEFGDRLAEARATGNLGYLLTSLGRFAEAKSHGERSLVLLRECGTTTDEAIALGNQGALLLWLGMHEEALALLDRCLELARELRSPRIEACALGYLGERLFNRGRAAEARPLHERQVELSREAGDRDGEASALVCLGTVEADEGQVEAAAAHFDAAIALAREVDLPTSLVVAAAERCCLPGGDPSAAASLLEELGPRTDLAARMRARWLLWRATREPTHLADAARLLDTLVAHAPAECRKSMIENVRLHREIRTAASAQATI